MNAQKNEDVKDMALRLNKIRADCPESYFYLKGWIHCLSQKETIENRQHEKSSKQIV